MSVRRRTLPAQRGLTNVYVHLAVPYTEGLHLQVIQPSGDAAMSGWDEAFSRRYPCIVFVQGSGWQDQALGAGMAPLCAFARRGVVIAIVEYRPSRIAPHPAQVEDARTAVRWLQEHADQYGIDTEQMFIAGDSSGGHTALMVHLEDQPGHGTALGLRGAISLYGVSDLTTMLHDEVVPAMLGEHDPDRLPEAARAASPAALAPSATALAPLLLIHGTQDEVVPLEQSTDYAEILERLGHPVELVVVDGGRHGIWPSFYTPQLGDIVEEFLTAARG